MAETFHTLPADSGYTSDKRIRNFVFTRPDGTTVLMQGVVLCDVDGNPLVSDDVIERLDAIATKVDDNTKKVTTELRKLSAKPCGGWTLRHRGC